MALSSMSWGNRRIRVGWLSRARDFRLADGAQSDEPMSRLLARSEFRRFWLDCTWWISRCCCKDSFFFSNKYFLRLYSSPRRHWRLPYCALSFFPISQSIRTTLYVQSVAFLFWRFLHDWPIDCVTFLGDLWRSVMYLFHRGFEAVSVTGE